MKWQETRPQWGEPHTALYVGSGWCRRGLQDEVICRCKWTLTTGEQLSFCHIAYNTQPVGKYTNTVEYCPLHRLTILCTCWHISLLSLYIIAETNGVPMTEQHTCFNWGVMSVSPPFKDTRPLLETQITVRCITLRITVRSVWGMLEAGPFVPHPVWPSPLCALCLRPTHGSGPTVCAPCSFCPLSTPWRPLPAY